MEADSFIAKWIFSSVPCRRHPAGWPAHDSGWRIQRFEHAGMDQPGFDLRFSEEQMDPGKPTLRMEPNRRRTERYSEGGTFMLGDPFDTADALLDATTLTYTVLSGTGKADRNDEEGWLLMPNGQVLTTDAEDAPNSELFTRKTETWRAPAARLFDWKTRAPKKSGLWFFALMESSLQREPMPVARGTLRITILRLENGR